MKLLALAATLALLLLNVVAPLGAAQNQDPTRTPIGVRVEFSLKDDRQLNNGRLPVESATVKYTVKAVLTFSPATACETIVTVRFQPLAVPGYAYVTLSPEQVAKSVRFKAGNTDTGGVAPAGGSETFETDLAVSLSRLAPALEDVKIQVRADAAPNGANTCNVSPGSEKGTLTVKPDYLPIMLYTPANQILKTGQNSGANFIIRMSNLGNGPTKVDIQAEATGKHKLESLLVPPTQTLDARSQGPTARTEQEIRLQLRTPFDNGYQNRYYQLEATFDASYDGHLTNGARDVQTLPLTIQVQGVYVPGFDVVPLAAACLAAVGLVTLRRRRP